MKKFLYILFWIFADALLIFGITFLPSLFSIFCFITAIFFIPIEEWQKILKKVFTKPILSLIIAVCIALVVAKFPIDRVVTGINKIINPPPTSSNFITSYEKPDVATSETETSSTITSSLSESTSSNENVDSHNSIEANDGITQNSTSSSFEAPTNQPTENSDETISNVVYRTPSGKRYHASPTCGGKNSYEVSFEEAMNDNLTPCKKCVK